ncbi:alanine--tRNA ligase 1 [Cocos nucifera]|uniref:Alanine--tRNA ligase 1 n=1 Tax=Cocos nucifera TaxID=13894 RepID=A0A8K0HU50_COCNU|nr:alanine--tRNA ligase 1 [Cocos nucifera]
MAMALSPTKLAYFDDMWTVESTAVLLSCFQVGDGRQAVILDATIFHPQGGGQPADTGFITNPSSDFKFMVEDVRLKDGLVFHYGFFNDVQEGWKSKLKEGQEVSLYVNAERRDLNSRLHSAGHLLDICKCNLGLSHLEPGKGYHFPDGLPPFTMLLSDHVTPDKSVMVQCDVTISSVSIFFQYICTAPQDRPFVEYKGIIPQDQLQTKQRELEIEANALISSGGKVKASILPYEEASKWCGGDLPSYISKSSTPRIVKFGDHPGCPCGGTHVADIANIRSLKLQPLKACSHLAVVNDATKQQRHQHHNLHHLAICTSLHLHHLLKQGS